MGRLLSTLLLKFIIIGFAVTGEKPRENLKLGMTQKEVITPLGNPDGIQKRDNNTVLSYMNLHMETWDNKGTADYYIYFDKDDMVAEYRKEEVRAPKISTGLMFIKPLP